MPARMPRRLLMLLCLAVLAAGVGACGNSDTKQGVDEAAREGLALPLDGIEYNVFITRELNPRITPDKSYVVSGMEPDATHTLYGVFLQTCNRGEEAAQTAERFTIVDNQGNRFEPTPLPESERLRLSPEGPRTGGVHPRERERGSARPDGGVHAAVPAAAREHGKPSARARGRGPERRPPHVQARHLGPAQGVAASSTTRAAGAAVAPPAPARTSITATTIFG